jgi:hypothetical protein
MRKNWSTKNDWQHKQAGNRILDWGATIEEELASLALRSAYQKRLGKGGVSYSSLEDDPVDERGNPSVAGKRP